MILKKMTYNDMIRMLSVALLVGAVAAVGAVGAVAAQDEDVQELQDEIPDDMQDPDELMYAVSDDVHLQSYEWDDGDVLLTLVSSSDGARVQVEDAMDIWNGHRDGYDEVLTLQQGVTQLRVPDAETVDAARGPAQYGVVVQEHGGDGIAPARGSVGYAVSFNAPPAGAGTVLGILLTALVTGASTYGMVRRTQDKPRLYVGKPKRGFLRWLLP